MSANVSLDPGSRPLRVTAAEGILVVPADGADLPNVAQAGLYIIAMGNVVFVDSLGHTITLTAVPAFTRIPIQARRVKATGTTATVLALN